MTRVVSGRARDSVVLSLSLLAGCASRAVSDGTTSGPWTLIAEYPGSIRRRVPVRPLGRDTSDWGYPYVVAEIVSDDREVIDAGLARGMEGSPIVDSTGALIGAVAEPYGDNNTPVFGLLLAGDLEQGWQRAGREGTRLAPESIRVSDPAPILEAGDSIALLESWGDVPSGLHFGSVTAIRGNEGSCLLEDRGGPRLPAGPCRLAVARARVLAIGFDGNRTVRLRELGEIVGTATYDGVLGARFTLGATPPVVTVTVRLLAEGVELSHASASVVRQPWGLERSIRENLMNLVWLLYLKSSGRVVLELAVDGGRQRTRREDHAPPGARIHDLVKTAIDSWSFAEEAEPTNSVELDIHVVGQ